MSKYDCNVSSDTRDKHRERYPISEITVNTIK